MSWSPWIFLSTPGSDDLGLSWWWNLLFYVTLLESQKPLALGSEVSLARLPPTRYLKLGEGSLVEPTDMSIKSCKTVHDGLEGWSSHCGSMGWVTNLTSIHEDVGSIPGPAQWVKDGTLP